MGHSVGVSKELSEQISCIAKAVGVSKSVLVEFFFYFGMAALEEPGLIMMLDQMKMRTKRRKKQ